MELRVLQYFLCVAREQSISAAAESLHLSQPTLSTQLRQMEEELGKQLLIRGTKGSRKVTLTEEGMLLRKRAEEILSLVRKTEDEIVNADNEIVGDVYIGSGETELFRYIAKSAKKVNEVYPDIHFHISSGNALYVFEQLDKGLIDFGLIFGEYDAQKYEAIQMPICDAWGILMHKDTPLAKKDIITPEDIWGLPLIISVQRGGEEFLKQWLQKDVSKLNIIATYNLVYNASLLVEEKVGYALCFGNLIHTNQTNLTFRYITPRIEASNAYVVWKRYQVFSKAAEKYLKYLKEATQIEKV